MINRVVWNKSRGGIFLGFMFLAFSLSIVSCNSGKLDIKVFKSEKGFGYDILENNRIYIHQPFIPVYQNSVPFPNYKSAHNTGKLVIKKLKQKKSPSLNSVEISEILEKYK